ncbi:hypothetical protein GCM10023185_45730 [Hymenobacter saemangeumensis]|uniref:DUF4384 domain-containing protein n=1 Tax=Hymenobacter saemangeumensis TaxID=1084522 RepID=A0ABP8ISP1_9BACT
MAKHLPGFCLRLLLLLALSAFPAAAQVYLLDIAHQPLRVPGLPVYVEQVLNGQTGSPAIGVVHHKFYNSQNRQEAVMFRKSLEADLTEWLHRKMPQRPTDQVLALYIRHLHVGEKSANSTTGSLTADVYLKLADGYHFVRQIAGHTESQGIETTYTPSYLLALLVQRSLLQLAGTDWAKASQQPALTLTQLGTHVPPSQPRPAVLRVAAPRRGVYFSFEQFLNNRPDTTAFLRPDTLASNASGWEGTIRLQPGIFQGNGQRAPKRDVWGYSDGRQAFVRQNNTYRALTRQGTFYTFVGPAPHEEQYTVTNMTPTGPVTTTTGRGSLFGADDNSSPPILYALDMSSGLAVPYPTPGQPIRADTAYVYVYRPLGGPAEARIVWLNNREVGRLRPGEFLELTCIVAGRAVRLRTDLPGDPALLFLPDASSANYLKLLPGTARSPWRYMPPRAGEAEVDALEKLRR